ncbi:MAG: LamG domain-containing protein [Rikenellaceae bacterium]
MRRIILALATIAVFATIPQAHAQSVVDEAINHIKLNESESSATPKDSATNTPCRVTILKPKRMLPEAVEDPQRGWVREFEARKTGLTTKSNLKVSGADVRTIAFWMKLDDEATKWNDVTQIVKQNNAEIVAMGRFSQPHGVVAINAVNGNMIRVITDPKASCRVQFQLKESLFNEWHHIIVTTPENGAISGVKVYVDGVDAGKGKVVDGKNHPIEDYKLNTAASPISFGTTCNALLSDIMIFDRALTPKEIIEVIRYDK